MMMRFIKFIGKHFFKNFRFLIVYLFLFFKKDGKVVVNPISFEELSHEIKKGKSMIRFGDGEIYIINYGSIHYQEYDAVLREIYIKIIKDYTINNNKYLLGVNNWALESSNIDLKSRGTFHCWLPFKAQFILNFHKKEKYFDAALFYRENIFMDYVFPYIKNKKIILISNKNNCEHVKSINYFNDIKYVITPSINSFKDYKDIKYNIDKSIKEFLSQYFKKRDIILLVACGPASKVLCYEFSMLNIQSLDIGKGIEVLGTDYKLDHMIK